MWFMYFWSLFQVLLKFSILVIKFLSFTLFVVFIYAFFSAIEVIFSYTCVSIARVDDLYRDVPKGMVAEILS